MRCWRAILASGSLALAVAGCTGYRAAPLPAHPDLRADLSALADRLPDGRRLDLGVPLDLQSVASLAVLNDPDLVAARAQHQLAMADLLAAGMPPDPGLSVGFGSLLGGPGSMPALDAALTQDIGALLTGPADRAAARAGLRQTDEGILWQEWQVAARAEQLVITLITDRATQASLAADAALLSGVSQASQAAITANRLTSVEGAAALNALTAVQSAKSAADLAVGQDENALDALLGLRPGTLVALAEPDFAMPAPAAVRAAFATLAARRPDLLALRYGYRQADAKLRAAILSQFLPISLGPAGGRDTSGIWSFGPQLSLTLPFFNRNRPAIRAAEATRAALRAQYQAALDNAAGAALALPPQIALLQSQYRSASAEAAQADVMAQAAYRAYRAGQISAPAYADLAALAGERQRNALGLRAQLQSAGLSLAILLGFGLPAAIPETPPS